MKPDTITAEQKEVYDYMTRQWQEEELLQLANHFHKLEDNSGQYARVKRFDMIDVSGFNLETSLVSMEIKLGLLDSSKRQVTFRPLLEIYRKNGESMTYLFEPVTNGIDQSASNKFYSEPVPAPYKNMVWGNWNDIDTNLIDDLFVAQAVNETGKDTVEKRMERVHSFIVDGSGLDVIKSLIGNITSFYIYPGVDLNKQSKIDKVTFTPIIGMVHPSAKKGNGSYFFSSMGAVEFGESETYVEYSRPCPPTCV